MKASLRMSFGHEQLSSSLFPADFGVRSVARVGIINYKSLITKVWRRGRDSNPRYPFGYAGFQDRSHQPLGHLSVKLRGAAGGFPTQLTAAAF